MQTAEDVMTHHVNCQDLTIRNGRRTVLDSFSWSGHPGGITWLVGGNGAGKSSLLRVLAGWQTPAAGSVNWVGLGNARICHLTPAMGAAPDLRVSDFVRFIHDTSVSDAIDVYLQALMPGSADLTRRFGTLSTGEAKRLLLWGMLQQPSGPLVLDEPYEHLSRDAKAALTDILRRRSVRNVVIVATNQDVPDAESDSTLTFNGERIEVGHAI